MLTSPPPLHHAFMTAEVQERLRRAEYRRAVAEQRHLARERRRAPDAGRPESRLRPVLALLHRA